MRTEATRSLLEREAERDALASAIGAASEGRGGLVLVEGRAGMGKSALLEWAAARASESGLAILSARGGELEHEFPFGVVRQLFEARLAQASPEERGEVLAGPAALAAPLVDGPPSAPGADVTFPALHGLFWLAANLSARQPLALLVDDAHWADPASLRALAYLGARATGLPLLLVVGTRPSDPAADAALLRAVGDAASVVLRPAPLSTDAAARLAAERLAGDVAPVFAEACHAMTAGNPFLVSELLASLAEQGAAPDEEGAARVRGLTPAAVRRAALTRLVRLGPEATRLAQAVAVLGTRADLSAGALLAELDEPAAAAAADALAEADLLRSERPLDFVHPLVRECVHEDMPPSRRAALHGRAARVLADSGAEGVAAHLLATDPSGDAWAVEQLEAAASRAVAAGAPDAAIRFLERALAEPPPAEARGRVLGALGSAEARLPAARGRAVEHLRQAAELAADPFTRLFQSLELGQALLMAGRVEESVEVLVAQLDALGDEHAEIGHIVQGALLVASYASVPARRMVAARGWRFEADEDAPPGTLGDRVWLAVRAFEITTAGGSAARARELAVRALDDGRMLADLTADSPVFYLAANTLMNVDALDEARAAFDAAIAEAQRRGSLRGFAMASCWRASTLAWTGDTSAAIADARATLDAVAEADLALGVPQAAAFLTRALVDAGELDQAEAAWATGREAGKAAGDQVGLDLLLHAAGRLRLAQGRHEEALELLLTCGRRQLEWGMSGPMIPWRSEAAHALAALGRGEESAALAEAELAAARAFGAARHLGVALRGVAASRPAPEAVVLLRESAEVLGPSPSRLERARTHVELGTALRHAGERAAARDPLRTGLTLARDCGAPLLAARAYDELEATGVQERRILRGGIDALTPSERRIAELAASGMSNRDIAASLFVTVRTVEAHLGHAYRKLGIAGRSGLREALS